MRTGFSCGYPPPFNRSFTPVNRKSAIDNPQVLDEYILEEMTAGRISIPLTKEQVEQVLGPFYACPLGLVPKAGDVLKWRVIRDLSAENEDGVSVNDLLDADLFPTEWGTAAVMEEMVSESAFDYYVEGMHSQHDRASRGPSASPRRHTQQRGRRDCGVVVAKLGAPGTYPPIGRGVVWSA
jgi:hypothetical protein